jgi:cytochrome c biogenesis protein CcmG/thiol:disulfide interchange protein DsbE
MKGQPTRSHLARAVTLGAMFATLLAVNPAPAAADAPPARLAPSFRLATAHGFVSLDSLRGKVVLVDFWASWCAPCKRSFPWMSALHDSLAARGFELVAINLDKDRDAAERFLEQNPARFTVAFDPGGESAEAYHVAAMPSSFVIAPDGRIALTHAGFDPRKTAEVEAVIRRLCPR